MDRLGFTLPDFCRVNWASEAARGRWTPAIQQAQRLWRTLETETVRQGVRKVGLVALPRGQKPDDITGKLKAAELYSISPRSSYVSDRPSARAGDALVIHAVGATHDVEAAVQAFSHRWDDVLGRLLGYPECCIKFFQEVWNEQRYIDTTWPMAMGSTPHAKTAEREVEFATIAETNVLLRWLSVRPVFHLPCSFQCKGTRHVAEAIRAVGKSIGQDNAVKSLYEILQWPVQWSALHGIAEIETPVFRISARTDASAQKHVVRLLGTSTPIDQAPAGIRFPYHVRKPAMVRQIAMPLARAPSKSPSIGPWLHDENGFRTAEDMHRALAPVVRAVAARAPRSVLHICCKNGALLHNLSALLPGVTVHGVDPDPVKIEHARLLMPARANNFRVGRVDSGISAPRWPEVDVCVLMLGRLLEVPRKQSAGILQSIRERAGAIVVYAFDDWLHRASLESMAESLGLQLIRPFAEEESVAQLI